MNEEYTQVKIILDKCLEKHDPTSQITFYIKGALAAGTKDTISLRELKKQIEMVTI